MDKLIDGGWSWPPFDFAQGTALDSDFAQGAADWVQHSSLSEVEGRQIQAPT